MWFGPNNQNYWDDISMKVWRKIPVSVLGGTVTLSGAGLTAQQIQALSTTAATLAP